MELLTDRQLAALRAAIDRIIPADDEQAGGVAAGVDAFILQNLSPGGYFPEKQAMYRSGLNALDALAQRMYSAPFPVIGEGAQDAALIECEKTDPGFFRLLVEEAQEGFYTSPAAYEMIGWKTTD